MEYLGRLGLVFRKKTEHGTSPYHAANSKATKNSNQRGSHVNPKSVINETIPETEHTQGLVAFRTTSSPQVKGAAVLGMKTMLISSDGTTAHYLPRQEVFEDIEYLEYEQHVKTRARAFKIENMGGRFGWKGLIFWKRKPKSGGMNSVNISAASTPVHRPSRTPLHPVAATPGRTFQGIARRGCATVGPLYTNESPTSMQQFSHRGYKSDGNVSPYVALPNHRQRIVSPGPLYRV